MSIKDIDNKTEEGKLLIAAIAIISTTEYTYLTPDEVLKKVIELW